MYYTIKIWKQSIFNATLLHLEQCEQDHPAKCNSRAYSVCEACNILPFNRVDIL